MNTKMILVGILACGAITAQVNADTRSQQESTTKVRSDGSVDQSSHFEGTDSTGASIKSDVQRDEGKTWTGKDKVVSKTESSRDPAGLGNKTSTEKETTVISDNDGNRDQKSKSTSVASDRTRHENTEEVKTRVYSDGSSETTVAREDVTDPKGMWNKKVSKSEEKVKRNADGTISRELEKSVH